MKNYSIILLGLSFIYFNCGSSKKPIPKDEVEVSIPCSGEDFFSSDKYFRSNSIGESLDQMTAKKKAMSNAKAQLAGDIESTMKIVTDNYLKSAEFNNKEELLERFEQNARTVINQRLKGIKQICEKSTRVKSTGKYKYYIAIELSGEELLTSYNEVLSKDQSLKIDYNYEKFKEVFNKEMEKFGN